MNFIELHHFEQAISEKLKNLLSEGKILKSSIKEDKSIVTEMDIFVSNLLKDHYQNRDFNFFSEEDFTHLKFPSIILDPIDGTNEMNAGIGECAVSLAMMNSNLLADPLNNAWIYNPFTGFSLSTLNSFMMPRNTYSEKLQTLVSRTEWKKGKYKNCNHDKFSIVPRGSVAFKLGLLSAGSCDFLISRESKKIWDIAAGTILCQRRGFRFYEKGLMVEKLEKMEYEAPLIWCREADFESIYSHFA